MKRFATKCRRIPHTGNHAGFTLVEMLVVMVILVVVIMISAGAFERIIKVAGVQTSSADSNIQGVVGLEIMRSDLAHAGFGLPWTPPGSATFVHNFEESQVAADALANGIDPAAFNSINNASPDPSKAPQAIQSASASGAEAWEEGRDYLAIKATSVAMNPTSKHWSYLDGIGVDSSIRQWGNSTDDVAPGDRVITLKLVTRDQKPYRELVGASAADFSYTVPAAAGGKYVPPAAYQSDSSDIFMVYGVSDSTDLKFPFNRVDYYIRRPGPTERPGIPARCAPGTGMLYKANLRHSDRLVDQYPLLDCVADMQVVYSLDSNGDGGVDFHGDESVLAVMTAEEIRTQLKEIRVQILTHVGGRDANFTYPASSVRVGDFGAGRDYNLAALDGIGTAWKNYRWKIYTIVAEPKNIKN